MCVCAYASVSDWVSVDVVFIFSCLKSMVDRRGGKGVKEKKRNREENEERGEKKIKFSLVVLVVVVVRFFYVRNSPCSLLNCLSILLCLISPLSIFTVSRVQQETGEEEQLNKKVREP